MSNLFKSNYIVCNETDKRVIDYNEVISAKVNAVKTTMSSADNVINADDFTQGLEEFTVDMAEEPQQPPEEIAEEIIAAANAEADMIIVNAQAKAEEMLQDAVNQGSMQGYEEGINQAQKEFNLKNKEFEKEKAMYEEAYTKKMAEMEPVLVETMLEVFAKVTNAISEDKKDMILHLVNSAMKDVERSNDFLIRVSSEDYKFLIENKDKITGSVSGETHIEIIEDPIMRKNDCIIETDGGFYECSLNIQLEELIQNIKLLACLS